MGEPSSGYFLLHRGWRDNVAFQDEPCSEREAWIWMIEEAAYLPRRKRVGNVVVSLARGQFAASTRFLAEAWGWTHSKARRFLDRLANEGMIGTSSDTGVTIVTLCNYDIYQLQAQGADTPPGTAAAQQRHSSGTNDNEGNQGNIIPVADATEADKPPAPPDQGPLDGDLFPPGADLPQSLQSVATPPAVDLKAQIFGACLEWLVTHTDKPQAKLRPALGRLCSKYGDGAVLEVLQNAARASPVDPLGWINRVISENYEAINGQGTGSRRRKSTSGHSALFEAGAQLNALLGEEELCR